MTPHLRNLTNQLAEALIWKQHDEAALLRAQIQSYKDQQREDTMGRDVCYILVKKTDTFSEN